VKGKEKVTLHRPGACQAPSADSQARSPVSDLPATILVSTATARIVATADDSGKLHHTESAPKAVYERLRQWNTHDEQRNRQRESNGAMTAPVARLLQTAHSYAEEYEGGCRNPIGCGSRLPWPPSRWKEQSVRVTCEQLEHQNDRACQKQGVQNSDTRNRGDAIPFPGTYVLRSMEDTAMPTAYAGIWM